MAKAGRWLRSFLSGKKEKEKEEEEEEKNTKYKGKQQQEQQPLSKEEKKVKSGKLQQPNTSPAPSPAAKEKRRWSFRRSTDTTKIVTANGDGRELNSTMTLEAEDERKRHAMAVAAATKAAADAAVAAAQAAAVVIRLTAAAKCSPNAEEEASAVRIQSVFRSYLARKALSALKGLVKLQALIRGELVRRLVTIHANDRAQRILMAKEAQMITMMVSQRRFDNRRSPSPLDARSRRTHDMDRNSLENVRIVEMDLHGTKWSSRAERTDKFFPYHYHCQQQQQQKQISPSASALTDTSTMAASGLCEELSFKTADSSPHYFSPMSSIPDSSKENMYVISNEYSSCPNYMANTESSKAKVRSQSTPRQRPSSPMRHSSMGSAIDRYQLSWKNNYCSSLVPYEVC